MFGAKVMLYLFCVQASPPSVRARHLESVQIIQVIKALFKARGAARYRAGGDEISSPVAPGDGDQVLRRQCVITRRDRSMGSVESSGKLRKRLIEYSLQPLFPLRHLGRKLRHALEIDDDRPLCMVAKKLLVGRDQEYSVD